MVERTVEVVDSDILKLKSKIFDCIESIQEHELAIQQIVRFKDRLLLKLDELKKEKQGLTKKQDNN